MDLSIGDIEPSHLERLVLLNNQHAAEVNALSRDDFARLRQVARAARVVGDCLAFAIAFDESTPAQGPNHAWFLAREPAFLYVDRIVVASEARRRGLASRLYEDLAALAAGRPLCCEVNVAPPNEVSLAFHERFGFKACGEATDPRNHKRVRYLVRKPRRS